jgi:hypothetical protein
MKYIITLIILFISTNLYSQPLDTIPIWTYDFEEGLDHINLFEKSGTFYSFVYKGDSTKTGFYLFDVTNGDSLDFIHYNFKDNSGLDFSQDKKHLLSLQDYTYKLEV